MGAVVSSEREKPELVATINATGQGRVTLDGRDISNHVMGVTVDTVAGQATQVQLKMGFIGRLDIRAQDVRVPDEDALVLQALGWVSPAETLTRYAELCRALGVTGATWDELFDEARELKANVDLEYGNG